MPASVSVTPHLKPLIKCLGGKSWLAPQLSVMLSSQRQRRFVELFAGGMASTLYIQPRFALLNDANVHVINLYQQIKDGLNPPEIHNDPDAYNTLRDEFNDAILRKQHLTPAAARQFYALNHSGFNGLCRFNQSGFYNVPFGKYKTITPHDSFLQYRESFQHWSFTARDFASAPINDDDVLYCDPPYDGCFDSYTPQPFSWEDQKRLATFVGRHRGPVIVSNSASERIIQLYLEQHFTIRTVTVPRSVAAKTEDRIDATEMLAFRNIPGISS